MPLNMADFLMPYTPVNMNDLTAGTRAWDTLAEEKRANREREAQAERDRMTHASIASAQLQDKMEHDRLAREAAERKEAEAILADMRANGAALDPAKRAAYAARLKVLGYSFGPAQPAPMGPALGPAAGPVGAPLTQDAGAFAGSIPSAPAEPAPPEPPAVQSPDDFEAELRKSAFRPQQVEDPSLAKIKLDSRGMPSGLPSAGAAQGAEWASMQGPTPEGAGVGVAAAQARIAPRTLTAPQAAPAQVPAPMPSAGISSALAPAGEVYEARDRSGALVGSYDVRDMREQAAQQVRDYFNALSPTMPPDVQKYLPGIRDAAVKEAVTHGRVEEAIKEGRDALLKLRGQDMSLEGMRAASASRASTQEDKKVQWARERAEGVKRDLELRYQPPKVHDQIRETDSLLSRLDTGDGFAQAESIAAAAAGSFGRNMSDKERAFFVGSEGFADDLSNLASKFSGGGMNRPRLVAALREKLTQARDRMKLKLQEAARQAYARTRTVIVGFTSPEDVEAQSLDAARQFDPDFRPEDVHTNSLQASEPKPKEQRVHVTTPAPRPAPALKPAAASLDQDIADFMGKSRTVR